MNNRNVLFLSLDEKSFYSKSIKQRKIDLHSIFKKLNFIQKGIRRILVKFNFSLSKYWFNNSWLKNIEKYNVIFVNDSGYAFDTVIKIRERNKNARVIVWYWNSVEYAVNPSQFNNLDCELWTFDENDAINYDMYLNTQFYFNDITLSNNNVNNDVFFVGAEKKRLSTILEIRAILENNGIKSEFHIVSSGKTQKNNTLYSPKISYSEVLEKISRSIAILDVVSEEQAGLTLRPLESIFFQKKLITNDKTIKGRDFYRENNVFILGLDNIDNLYNFIRSPYEPIASEVVNQYDFNSWLNRFFNKKF